MFLFLGLFIRVAYGIALPLAPRTASGWNTTSTSAAVPPPLVTAIASIPSQWVPVPSSLELPCDLQVPYGCVTSTWAYNEDPPNEYHSIGNNFIDPYYNFLGAVGTDYDYDTSCGSIWSTSLLEWMKTAPTTLGPEVPASEVWSIVTGTTEAIRSTSREYSQSTVFQSISTQSNGVPLYIESDQDVETWESATTWTTTTTGITSLLSTRSAHRDAYFLSGFTYTAATPCCSSCTLFGGTVQVFQWPTPAPSPPVSILVDEKNNFTFTSPSIYVAFQSLFATNLCGTIGGEVVTDTTIGFSTDELSTSQIYTYSSTTNWWNMPYVPYGFTLATWGQIETCTPITSTFYQALANAETWTDLSDALQYSATMTDIMDDGGTDILFRSYTGEPMIGTYTITYNPCQPILSVPTPLYSLESLWTGCVPGLSGFYDPPYTLTTAGPMGLATPTETAVPDHDQPHAPPASQGMNSKSAAPVATPKPQIPAPTSAPKPGTGPGSDRAGGNTDPKNDPPAPSPSAYIIGGQNLSPGGPGITISNTVISLLPGGSSVVLGGTKTVPLATFLETGAFGEGGVGFVFGSQTLRPGLAVTVGETVWSLDPKGSSVVVEAGSGAGKTGTKTEGISVLIAGGISSSETQSGGLLAQTGNGVAGGNGTLTFTGGARRAIGTEMQWAWIMGAFCGVWIVWIGFL